MKRASVQSSGEAKKTRSCEEPGFKPDMENKQTGTSGQKRLEEHQMVEHDDRSVIFSDRSVKPSESGYGSASIHSGQEQSKSGSGSGSGSGSSKSKSLGSESASGSTHNGYEDGQKKAFGKDSLKRRSLFKSCKPPSPDAVVAPEDVKTSEVPSAPTASQRNQSAKEARALQAVALTRALDCIQKISNEPENVERDGKRSVTSLLNPEAAKKVAKEVKLGLKEKGRDWRALLGPDIVTDMSQSFAFLETEPGVKRKESFFIAISLETGCVVYVTSSMTEKLAFHSDMWTGRNLLDFLHPKDRLVFTNYVTSGLMGTPGSMTILNPDCGDPSKLSLCVRFRVFKSLKSSGFAVVEKKTSYLPFKLNLNLHKQPKDGDDNGEEDLFILVHALPIKSAYSHSEQNFSTGRFSLRHNSASCYNEVDPASIPLLGHMPQDLIGISALDFYHPSDLAAVRDTYCAVLQRHGKSVRSIPFHFKAQNGCYVLLETDWSCFINPWSKKLEFVIGNHRVVKGPSNPDVFAPSDQDSDDIPQLTDEDMKIVNEIRNMLGGVGGAGGAASPKRRDQDAAMVSDQSSHRRRRRELAILMGTLLDEVTRAQTVGSSRSNSPRSPLCDLSVVIGDISPHRGASPESSDTPVSYSQLNYNENIERYFQSQPKLLPSESSEEKQFGKLNSSSDESKGSNTTGTVPEDRKHKEKSVESTINNEGNSGQATDSQSQLLSSERTSATGSGGTREAGRSRESCSEQEGYHGPELTTEVLRRHNATMEHDFMERMKASRLRNVGRAKKEKNDRMDGHGVKRGVGSSWDDGSGGYQTQQKHAHRDMQQLMPGFAPMGTFIPMMSWPSFSLPAQSTTQAGPSFTMHGNTASFAACTTTSAGGSVPNVVPAYYMSSPPPNSAGQPSVMQPVFVQSQGSNLTMPYLGGMVAYQPFYIPQSYMLPSVPFVSPAVEEQMSREPVPEGSRGAHPGGANRCPSQATSVKAEPGSQAPSNASFIARKEIGTTGTEGERPASESRSLVEEPLSAQSQTGVDSWQNPFSFDEGQIEAEDRCQRIYDSELSDGSSNGVWSDFGRQAPPQIRRTPPWMQSVESTPDLVYRYQLPEAASLAEILERDRAALQQLHQPAVVNDQLVALYREFEAEDRMRLNLEEGENTTSSSMSSEEPTASQKRKTRRRDDFRRSMIYEENAAMPAPDST